jgi:hypothetical protein
MIYPPIDLIFVETFFWVPIVPSDAPCQLHLSVINHHTFASRRLKISGSFSICSGMKPNVDAVVVGSAILSQIQNGYPMDAREVG